MLKMAPPPNTIPPALSTPVLNIGGRVGGNSEFRIPNSEFSLQPSTASVVIPVTV